MSAYSEIIGMIPRSVLESDPLGSLSDANRREPHIPFKTRKQILIDTELQYSQTSCTIHNLISLVESVTLICTLASKRQSLFIMFTVCLP